jgi:hypothetical protein
MPRKKELEFYIAEIYQMLLQEKNFLDITVK